MDYDSKMLELRTASSYLAAFKALTKDDAKQHNRRNTTHTTQNYDIAQPSPSITDAR